MRGRRGRSSPSVSQVQDRMPLRKQVVKDAGDTPSGSQEFDNNTQDEDEALDDNGELSSSLLSPSTSREKRKKERETRSKPKEMTEEEMMDLALRLSEQEASITALRRQKEEEAVMKAIHESMVSQTQPCPASQSQSLLLAEASRWTGSRRKLSFPNGRPASDIDQAESEDCTPEIDHPSTGAKRSGEESNTRNKRRKGKAGSPLLEMPDLSQTQMTSSQASAPSSECLDLNLDSQQSSESTQIDECRLRKSPVFPLTGCRPEVHVPRLSQDLLETVRTSGFVLCTQDSEISPPRPKSPTFPKSPSCSANRSAPPKSPVFSGTVPRKDDKATDSSPEYVKSPVFGRNTQREKSPGACKPQSGVCNSGFTFTSQESLTSSVRSASCQPKSPVFPKSPVPPPIEISDSPTFPEQDVGRQEAHLDERRESTGGPAQDSETKDKQDVRLNKATDDTAELNETPKDRNSAETELTSDMRLLWSDSDDDVTLAGSPSPVFPEEKPGSPLRPFSSSSSSSGRQQLSTAGCEQRPVPSSEPAGGQTVHYYWGVPFCPRGLDPDTYTQVILAQMEVYEKSLKQAQRGLLRKAEWGEPILPQPEKSPSPPESPADSPQPIVSRRRGLRLNRQRLSDAAETPPVEVEDEDDNKGEEEEEEKEVQEERKRETRGEEEEKKDEGGEELDADVCEVCPETQLSDDDRMQDQMMETDASPQLRPKSPEIPEVEMVLPDDSPAREEPREEEEEMEVEVDDPVDRKKKGNTAAAAGSSCDAGLRNEEVEEDMEDTYVEERKDGGLQRSACAEPEPAVVPESPETSVDCPICQQSFPVTEIEIHAAYCDGEVAVTATRRPKTNCFQASPKPRRKRTRRGDVMAEDSNDSSDGNRKLEKCFICQRAVPQSDFGRHTELCLQRQTAKTAARGNLVSALEQTDSRDSEPGPSRSRVQTGDVIDLLDDDDDDEEEEGGVSAATTAFSVSNSPIRSFTPISEATGCLIDFKKPQRSKRLVQRRR